MNRITLTLAGLLLLGAVKDAQADILYGTDGATSDLIQINSSTGASMVVGNMGIGNGIGLAINGITGVAYTRNFDTLFTVDLNSAATSPVGPSVGVGGVALLGLTFDQNSTTLLYSLAEGNGEFYTVDPATGTAALVGNTGVNNLLDLTTSSAGTIFAASQSGGIFTIDPLTGLATVIFPSVDSRGLTALSFDANGNLFGVTLNDDILVQINLNTGTTTDIGGPLAGSDIRGLDSVPQQQEAVIPEPTSLALFGLTTVTCAGYVAWRRRKHSVADLSRRR